MASAAVTAVVSLPPPKSSSSLPNTSSIVSLPLRRIRFHKACLYSRSVSTAKARKLVSVRRRAQQVTRALATAATVSKKDVEGVVTDKFTTDDPYVGTCLRNTTITGDGAPAEICHIVINTEGEIPYKEGQSIGVIPEGAEKASLYSIASSVLGDLGDSKTLSLCVKRVFYTNEQGEVVKGVSSNYLCDLKSGDEVKLTGPSGTELLMPKDQSATVIMLANGTGVAPFRGFLWKMFLETHDDYKFTGLAWLFFGVPTSSSLLYTEEFDKMKKQATDNFRVNYAISGEQTDEDGNKMYVQTRVAEYGDEVWELIKKENTYVYLCGSKDMETGIDEVMSSLAEKDGIDWSSYKSELEEGERWNLEVY